MTVLKSGVQKLFSSLLTTQTLIYELLFINTIYNHALILSHLSLTIKKEVGRNNRKESSLV